MPSLLTEIIQKGQEYLSSGYLLVLHLVTCGRVQWKRRKDQTFSRRRFCSLICCILKRMSSLLLGLVSVWANIQWITQDEMNYWACWKLMRLLGKKKFYHLILVWNICTSPIWNMGDLPFKPILDKKGCKTLVLYTPCYAGSSKIRIFVFWCEIRPCVFSIFISINMSGLLRANICWLTK